MSENENGSNNLEQMNNGVNNVGMNNIGNVPPINNSNNVNLGDNKKSKWKFIIGGLVLLVVIAVGLYFGYNKINGGSSNIYKTAVNDVYEFLSDNLKEADKESKLDINFLNDPIVMAIDAKFTTSMSELKNFNNLNYNINIGMDYKNEKMTIGAGISDSNSPIVKALVAYTNKNMYLKSEQLFNKVINIGEYDLFGEIKSSVNELTSNVSYDIKDIEFILKEMKTIVGNAIDESQIVVSDEKITIDNKDYNTKKASYKLNSKNMKYATTHIADDMLKNEKLLNTICSVVGISENDLKSALEEMKDTDFSDMEEVIINLYALGNDVIAGNLEVDNEELITFTNKDKFHIVIADSTDEMVIDEIEDGFKLVFNEDNTEIFSLTGSKNRNDEYQLDFAFNYDGVKMDGYLNLTEGENKKDKTSGDFKLSVNINALQKVNFTLDGTVSIEKKALEEVDTKNSVEMDSLSDSEMTQVYNNLYNILNKLGLSSLLEDM